MKVTDPNFKTILKEAINEGATNEARDDVVSNRIKNYLKSWPNFYNFLKITIGPDSSPFNHYNLKSRIDRIFAGNAGLSKIVLNIGSGTNRIHPEIINVDIFAFKNVDVVADIANMPFEDGTIDGVVCDTVLEHIADTQGALREMSRILKPGGTLLMAVPFLYPYHSSPDDFFRWTEEGLTRVLKENNLKVDELGIRGGPMGALQGILMHIFALLFSFGSKTLYFLLIQFFMILFSPLKVFDLFFMLFPHSIEAASSVFVVAEKN